MVALSMYQHSRSQDYNRANDDRGWLRSAGERTFAQISLLHLCSWRDVKVEYVDWNAHRRTCVRYVNNPSNMALHWCAGQK